MIAVIAISLLNYQYLIISIKSCAQMLVLKKEQSKLVVRLLFVNHNLCTKMRMCKRISPLFNKQ